MNQSIDRQIVQLASCGHVLHHKCFMDNFRCHNKKFGRCPVCDTILCERSFMDRIEMDRDAIFGTEASTTLLRLVNFNIPQQHKVFPCINEELLAVGQLRVLKNKVHICLQKYRASFPNIEDESEWHTVVQAAVDKFRAEGLPMPECRYISNSDAFLEFVSWAQLVRLLNSERATVKQTVSSDAPFILLETLHQSLYLAKQDFDF
jgi:hypothetical protein